MHGNFRYRRLTRTASIGVVTLLITAFAWSAPALASGSCSSPITAAPTGPATVSATTISDLHRVLVVGSGPNAGCSLYTLTSDQPNATPPTYACPAVCATTIWPALLTNGKPVAGPGVNPSQLGTVTRTDVLANTSVQQVTYNGAPIYQYSVDAAPKQTNGLNLFDPFTGPQGVWYLLSPGRGLPDTGAASVSNETVTVTKTGASASVLSALLDQGSGNQLFPVYTFSSDSGDKTACQGQCAVNWPPVLTDGRAKAGAGVNASLIDNIVRPDGSHQVTYQGHPLYFFRMDAALPGTPGVAKGSGVTAFGGTFNLIPPQ